MVEENKKLNNENKSLKDKLDIIQLQVRFKSLNIQLN